MNNKFEISSGHPIAFTILRVFVDPLIAWWMAGLLAQSVPQLKWLNDFGYWAWVGIVVLIQALWGTNSPSLIAKPYKPTRYFRDKLEEKES